ncbi:MAG TPA: TIGR03086 family metal-binding protein [Acidimicrobiales bacterium]
MSEIADRYRRLSDAFAAKVAAVPADAWSKPTPCDGWTARDLVRHVIDTQGMFLRFVGRSLGDIPSVDDDPVAAWDAARAVVQADLEDPERAAAEYDSMFGRTRWEDGVDRFLNFDLVVHGWDLAQATGLDDTIDPDDAARVLAAAQGLGDILRTSGQFGPELPVPPDADVQTRLIAYLGRKPI